MAANQGMEEMTVKKYIRYLFGTVFILFILNKFYLRPWVLENELPELFQIFVFSIPNLIEAILGTIILTGILLQLRQYSNKKIKDSSIYLIAVGISSLYVISQELKFHNLGGNNVYDPYDLIASIIGLLMTFMIIRKFGFIDLEEK
ncbi:MAG: hypothetical protein ACR2MT_02200 [Aurantibacter sp.]